MFIDDEDKQKLVSAYAWLMRNLTSWTWQPREADPQGEDFATFSDPEGCLCALDGFLVAVEEFGEQIGFSSSEGEYIAKLQQKVWIRWAEEAKDTIRLLQREGMSINARTLGAIVNELNSCMDPLLG